MSFANIFSHSVSCLLVFVIISLAVQKLLILMKSHTFIFSFVSLAFGDVSWKSDGLLFKEFTYLLEREREGEHKLVERQREREKHIPHRVGSLTWGSIQYLETMTWAKGRHLMTIWATQMPHESTFKNMVNICFLSWIRKQAINMSTSSDRWTHEAYLLASIFLFGVWM